MSLTDVAIRKTPTPTKPKKLVDSHGLYLHMFPNGARYWRLKYRIDGKEKLLAIGVYPEVPLAEARRKRDAAKKLLAEGIDPSQGKEKRQESSGSISTTLEQAARQWHAKNAAKWTPEHSGRILIRLQADVFPEIGNMPIANLRTKDLLSTLEKVERRGALDLASRLRQILTGIFRFAVQTAIIDQNPAADLAGAIAVRKAVHRPALPLSRIPELMQKIDAYKGRIITMFAVRFQLLTFVRSSEMRMARWSEIDFKRQLWTIPAAREAIPGARFSNRGSKMREPHLVPLSRQAVNLLEKLHSLTGDYELLFAGDHDYTKPISEGTVNKALQRMGFGQDEICGHGFRTMACSALLESGLWSSDAIERQMSHRERNSVRAAYTHKAEFLGERARILQWWSDYLDANQIAHVPAHEFRGADPKLHF
ncbi:tyrosine-type recombinase/integrase [Silvimonas soli]|uniref:tyrosine-type recombinase/integrase n=1 Tax=Silvimonas soli TaxID=2980100 RepID=UPI0024B35A4C|nr:integrase arm-type DNA-binding domain-containing protein [Silvimonas soli]